MRLQLIKQLSATPTIPAQRAADVAEDVPDPQSALRANKEVFFFRLVRPIFQKEETRTHSLAVCRSVK